MSGFAKMVRNTAPEIPLDRAAALISSEEHPDLDPERAIAALDTLAEGIHLRAGRSLYEHLARINHHLFVEHGFRGDEHTYDAPDNSCLHRVIARRKGQPILMSIVYLEIARRLGVPLEPVNFPSHFLIRPARSETPFFIDPFFRGEIRRERQLRARLHRLSRSGKVSAESWQRSTAACSPTAVLIRVNQNLKRSWARRGDAEGALRAVERILALSPDTPRERRERAMLLAQLGRDDEARQELESCLYATGDPQEAYRSASLLTALKR